jgi:hypothetical protein
MLLFYREVARRDGRESPAAAAVYYRIADRTGRPYGIADLTMQTAGIARITLRGSSLVTAFGFPVEPSR